MSIKEIDKTFKEYIETNELPNAVLLIYKNGEFVYKNKWGYADIENHKPIEYDSIFKVMSMTKVVVAVGIMKLIDSGKLDLDDELSKYIPSFKSSYVVKDRFYILKALLNPTLQTIKTIPANRNLTIRDLLSHSAGIDQGWAQVIYLLFNKEMCDTNEAQAEKYSKLPLGFHPGTKTGYSPIASFDILVRIIEVASGMTAEEYFQKEIFEPLEMNRTSFYPSKEDMPHIVETYEAKKGKLINVTNQKNKLEKFVIRNSNTRYISGSGGLYSTPEDYEHLARMLLQNGVFNGKRVLTENSVELMHTEAAKEHLEPEKGFVWGLGVKIRQNPKIAKDCYATQGTYGWSGAFGTHFFVSPKDNMEVVFMSNYTNSGGSGSPVNIKLEKLVFDTFKG